LISTDHVRLMARYNRWQNTNLYHAAASLTDDARRQNRGAFFGSIHGTLSHLMWGDLIWMHRFARWEKPAGGIKDSPGHFSNWAELAEKRKLTDETIVSWADAMSMDWLIGDLTWYSGAMGRDVSKAKWLLVTHFFNHQTHHRGQVHAMLTAAGAKPDATDIPFMPNQS
jgi:uncharacterized damage-inducible protein DinB